MERSELINELAVALSKAQGVMKASGKSGTNPFLKYDYATFDDVLAAVRKPLADNGLSFMQLLDEDDDRSFLITILMHSSGQYFKSRTELNAIASKGTNALQDFGKAITYMKRYALAAMLGVASDEDDDGTSAKDASPKKKAKVAPKKQTTTQPSGMPQPVADAKHIVVNQVGAYKTSTDKKILGFWEVDAQWPAIYWWKGRDKFLDEFADDVMTKDELANTDKKFDFNAKVFYTEKKEGDKVYKNIARIERIA